MSLFCFYQQWQLKKAINRLKKGKIIAYPTEAVYGLGCDPFNETAVTTLLQLKERTSSKGLILLTHSLALVQPLIKTLPLARQQEVLATWPGPVTWLLPAPNEIPAWVRGEHTTVAVRVTAHPVAAALCQQWGNWLVSTSANKSDCPPAHSAKEVKQIFGHDIDYIIKGKIGNLAKPTQIRDGLTGEIIRAG